MSAFPPNSLVWCVDAELSDQPYVEATVLEADADGTIIVQPTNFGAPQRKKPHEVFPANSPDEDGFSAAPEDHCGLMHLNEATLLHATRQLHLRKRS